MRLCIATANSNMGKSKIYSKTLQNINCDVCESLAGSDIVNFRTLPQKPKCDIFAIFFCDIRNIGEI